MKLTVPSSYSVASVLADEKRGDRLMCTGFRFSVDLIRDAVGCDDKLTKAPCTLPLDTAVVSSNRFTHPCQASCLHLGQRILALECQWRFDVYGIPRHCVGLLEDHCQPPSSFRTQREFSDRVPNRKAPVVPSNTVDRWLCGVDLFVANL
ncbi:hypothetical protein BJV82DRAFT_127444 [Fennellomyces sp. T-0311]|nr:hypothetical protein BJV82DRAFT_127444 [Fennellomyces sp. T-0311]